MILAVGIIVFAIIVLLLILLIFIVTRYFNHRLRKSIRNPNQTYSMTEGIRGNEEIMDDTEYDQFLLERLNKSRQTNNLESKMKQMELTTALGSAKSPLKPSQSKIYGSLQARNKLQKLLQTPKTPLSIREIGTPKMFNIDQIGMQNEGNGKVKEKLTSQINSPISQIRKTAKITKHKYISKMVAYNPQGISIIDIKIKHIWVQSKNGPIRQQKQTFTNLIKSQDTSFLDTLEAYGFEHNIYESYKIVTFVSIPSMQPFEQYNLENLKKKSEKQTMSFPSFYYARDETLEK